MSDTKAKDVGEFGGINIEPQGHWLYCRKCKTEEMAGLVALTEYHQEHSMFVIVLAKGPRVGRPRDKKKWPNERLRELNLARCLDDCIRVGDQLLMPETHPWGLKRSPINPLDEFFIDESVPLGIRANSDRSWT